MFASKRRPSQKLSFPGDCTICATRPSLFLNQINVCPATFYCSHSNPSSKPHFQPSFVLKSLNFFCCALLVVGIINDVHQLSDHLTIKDILLVAEMLVNACTITVNLICWKKNFIKIQESHGLITLIANKMRFEFDELLDGRSAKRIHNILLMFLLVLLFEELITFCRTIILEELDFSMTIRMLAIEIIIFSNASIGLYVLQFFNLYATLFQKCYEEIEKSLTFEECMNVRMKLHKLQRLQRFYLCLIRNFKLNEAFIQPGIIVIYSIDMCLLLIGYSYLTVMMLQQEVALLKFDVYIVGKSTAIVFFFCFFCYEAQRVLSLGNSTLSFLFRCPTSKLNALEAAQVEMLIASLSLQKPELKASDIFTVGTGLLASVSSTVLTYVLVAVQFHALWAVK